MDILPAVKAIIQKDSKFLILKKTIGTKIVWDLPGGKVEYGENPYETLAREVFEETTIDIEIMKPLGMYWFFRILDNKQILCTVFTAKIKNGEINLEHNVAKDENLSEYIWITAAEFLKDDYIVDHVSLKDLIKGLDNK